MLGAVLLDRADYYARRTGIARKDIVLGFVEPLAVSYSEFAVA